MASIASLTVFPKNLAYMIQRQKNKAKPDGPFEFHFFGFYIFLSFPNFFQTCINGFQFLSTTSCQECGQREDSRLRLTQGSVLKFCIYLKIDKTVQSNQARLTIDRTSFGLLTAKKHMQNLTGKICLILYELHGLFSGYSSIEAGQAVEAMADITGGFPVRTTLSTKRYLKETWNFLYRFETFLLA